MSVTESRAESSPSSRFPFSTIALPDASAADPHLGSLFVVDVESYDKAWRRLMPPSTELAGPLLYLQRHTFELLVETTKLHCGNDFRIDVGQRLESLHVVGSKLDGIREHGGIANQLGLVPSQVDSSDICPLQAQRIVSKKSVEVFVATCEGGKRCRTVEEGYLESGTVEALCGHVAVGLYPFGRIASARLALAISIRLAISDSDRWTPSSDSRSCTAS